MKIGSRHRNVFVTQLGDEDEGDDIVRHIPVVRDVPRTLLEESRSTLQSTKVIQKRKEMEAVQLKLIERQEDFALRMDECAKKQQQLRQKQQQIRERVRKFEKFLKENEAKQQRANNKFISERKLLMQKETDLSLLKIQLKQLERDLKTVRGRLKSHEMYKIFLQNVVDSLPDDYIEITDPHIRDIMMRHRTLNETNEQLKDQAQFTYDEIERCQAGLSELMKERNNSSMVCNSTVASLQKELEHKLHANANLEQQIIDREKLSKEQCREVGEIKMAVLNLNERCQPVHNPNDRDRDLVSLIDALGIIKNRLLDLDSIMKAVYHDLAKSIPTYQ